MIVTKNINYRSSRQYHYYTTPPLTYSSKAVYNPRSLEVQGLEAKRRDVEDLSHQERPESVQEELVPNQQHVPHQGE